MDSWRTEMLGDDTPKNKPVCDCKVSTGICGCLTYGKGRLDFNGFWEIPCPHKSEKHTC
jgi:hypothetical protein